MRYAKKIYQTTPRKQHRQMTSPNVIPAVRMKAIAETRDGKREAARHLSEPTHPFHHPEGSEPLGEERKFRETMRETREVGGGPLPLGGND